jgi:hypothetical protein
VSFSLFLSACGALSASAHCDFDDHNRCQERLNSLSAEAFKATCTAGQGKPADGPCRTEGKVGGCSLGTQGDGSPVNDWYYAPKTKADAMGSCGSGETFIEP